MAIDHVIRTKSGKTRKTQFTPLSAIRHHCLECVFHVPGEVARCSGLICPLYPFRLGRHPGRQGIGGRRKKQT